jgi:hypothetical protein
MKHPFVFAIILPLILISCSPKKAGLVTWDLQRSDYREVIAANGAVQAVRNANIMAPMDLYGNLTVGSMLPEGSRVEAGDTICVLKCDEFTKMLDDREKALENLKIEMLKLGSTNESLLAVLEARLKENIAGMAVNELDSIQMRFAPPVKKKLMELERAKSHVESRKLNKKFVAQKSINETEVRQLKSRIIQAETELDMMKGKVGQLIIKAPAAGILIAPTSNVMVFMIGSDGTETQFGGYPKAGASIYPELPLASLPDLSEMEVKCEVPEVDYKRIEKGQKVELTVDAAANLLTTGLVKTKSLTPKMHYSEQANVKYFEVTVSVDSLHTRMVPGLSARCRILTCEVKDTLVVPSLAIFEKDSIKLVYVAEGERFRGVPVETGLSNSSQTIIAKGLTGKETIALTEPKNGFLIEKK